MPLSPDLFDSTNPPALWVTLAAPDSGEAVTRTLTVRVREAGRRSITASVELDRYSPESSILIAVGHAIERIQALQIPLSKVTLEVNLMMAIRDHVAPF
jgi:hypothetical protein